MARKGSYTISTTDMSREKLGDAAKRIGGEDAVIKALAPALRTALKFGNKTEADLTGNDEIRMKEQTNAMKTALLDKKTTDKKFHTLLAMLCDKAKELGVTAQNIKDNATEYSGGSTSKNYKNAAAALFEHTASIEPKTIDTTKLNNKQTNRFDVAKNVLNEAKALSKIINRPSVATPIVQDQQEGGSAETAQNSVYYSAPYSAPPEVGVSQPTTAVPDPSALYANRGIPAQKANSTDNVGAVTPPEHDSKEAAKQALAENQGANIVYGDGRAGDGEVAYSNVTGVMEGGVMRPLDPVEQSSHSPEDPGVAYSAVDVGDGRAGNGAGLALADATLGSTTTEAATAIYGNAPIVEAHNAKTAATESVYGNASIVAKHEAKKKEASRRAPPLLPTETAPEFPMKVKIAVLDSEVEGEITKANGGAYKLSYQGTRGGIREFYFDSDQFKKITNVAGQIKEGVTWHRSNDGITVKDADGLGFTAERIDTRAPVTAAASMDMGAVTSMGTEEADEPDKISVGSLGTTSGESGRSTPSMPSPSVAADMNQHLSTGQVQVSDRQKEELDQVFKVTTLKTLIEPGRLQTLGLDGEIQAISFVKNSNLDYGQDTGNSSFFVLVDEAGNMAVSDQSIGKLNQNIKGINDSNSKAIERCNLNSATVDGLAEALSVKTTVAKETLVERIKEERGKAVPEIARAGGASAGR